MKSAVFVVFLAAEYVMAYPFVAEIPGVDTSALKRSRRAMNGKRQAQGACPFNPNHPGAAPYTSQYPYTGAKNGLPGTGKGGIKVPANGDTAHAFEAPAANDIRGPCPGLNTAANHHASTSTPFMNHQFLSHDGITTFTELIDAQQNLYNVNYDLAVTLATLGVGLDGDVLTGKLSIGCDVTSQTSATGDLLGDELGLDGHNKFEGDTSLTRNDYYLANGDDHTFNGTLFGMMQNTCQGNFNRANLAEYRYQRYQQSLAENGNFYFGPKSVLLFGAASFLYELFPSLGPSGKPDLPTISSFFGASHNSDGSYSFNNHESIPADWYNRVSPYSNMDVTNEILAQYLAHPVLFGGNTGAPNTFDTLSFDGIQNGKLPETPNGVLCLIYQLATENVPSSLANVVELPLQVLSFATSKLNPIFANYGCPLRTI